MTITSDAPTYVRTAARPYTPAMAKRKMLGVQIAREQFKDVLDAAEGEGTHTVLLRRSRPSAIVVPPDWYHRACEALGDPWDDWQPPAAAE